MNSQRWSLLLGGPWNYSGTASNQWSGRRCPAQRERMGPGTPHFSSILPSSTSTSLPWESNLRSQTLLDPQCCKETARHRSERNSQDEHRQHPKALLTQTSWSLQKPAQVLQPKVTVSCSQSSAPDSYSHIMM